MRYGIISDIHGNLEALQAVLQACRKQSVDGILCAGDIVGYGANPSECLAVLKEVEAICVAGNHDWAVAAKLNAIYFPSDGKEAINWTRGKLSFEDIMLLSDLNLSCRNDDLVFVHSSPNQPEVFAYLADDQKAKMAFDAMEQSICFIGHTHVPQVYTKRGKSIINTNTFEFEVNPDYEYIINVGSVGQPRDGNPMASYCIYDSDAQMIELKRIQYDIQSAQRKIIEAGLPEFLSQRLSLGR